MEKRFVVAAFVLLVSLAVPAFGADLTDFASDFALPDLTSTGWLVSTAAASLIGLRLYLSRKR